MVSSRVIKLMEEVGLLENGVFDVEAAKECIRGFLTSLREDVATVCPECVEESIKIALDDPLAVLTLGLKVVAATRGLDIDYREIRETLEAVVPRYAVDVLREVIRRERMWVR